jgi:hypothetical protein
VIIFNWFESIPDFKYGLLQAVTAICFVTVLKLATSENHGLDLIESWHNATFEQIQNDLKAKQFVKLKDYNQIKIKFD